MQRHRLPYVTVMFSTICSISAATGSSGGRLWSNEGEPSDSMLGDDALDLDAALLARVGEG